MYTAHARPLWRATTLFISLSLSGIAFAQTPPVSGMVVSNQMALDNLGNEWGPFSLSPMTGVPSQQWIYYPDSKQLQATNFTFNGGWVGLQNYNGNLIIGGEDVSPQFQWTWDGSHLRSMADNQYLVANGTNITLSPTASSTWTLGVAGPQNSPYVPSGFSEIWGDEFTGVTMSGVSAPQVDTSKWVFRYSYSGGTLDFLSGNYENERYREGDGISSQPNHIITPQGTLKLTAYPANPDGTYDSGMVRSKKFFNLQSQQDSFYFEAKVKKAAGTGTWGAFWLSGTANADGSLSWPPEIDISETAISGSPPLWDLNQNDVHMGPQTNNLNPGPWNNVAASWISPLLPDGAVPNWHWEAPGTEIFVNVPFDDTAAFHIYGLLVTPGKSTDPINPLTNLPTHHVYYYIDGQEVLEHVYDWGFWPDGTPCRGADLLLNLAIGGRMGGTPNITGPTSEEYDYVRVYSNHPNDPAIMGTAGNLVDYPVPTPNGY